MTDSLPRTLSIVIPVFNGAASIAALVESVLAELQPRFEVVEVVLVNDGSADDSDRVCRQIHERFPDNVCYVQLARNFGEHNAVLCGLRYSSGEAVAIIDDDFQNPPAEIMPMVETLAQGHDVVYSYYAQKEHSLLRNLGSRFNDRVATVLLKKPRDLYLSSFKVLNRFLVNIIVQYEGPFPYIDGLILRSTTSIGTQLVAHNPREEGKSNYTLRRLVRLWLNMATSFSVIPLRVASLVGFALSATGLLLGMFFIYTRLYGGVFLHQDLPPGWASIIVVITLFSGIQLSLLGVIGEYLGRVFMTLNRAPQTIVRDTLQREELHD